MSSNDVGSFLGVMVKPAGADEADAVLSTVVQVPPPPPLPATSHNLLTNASFAKQPEYCGPPPGWFLNANGGTENACAYNKPSGAQQGSTYLEFNANVAGASVGQNIGIAPQIGQSYTFSTWVKAPSGSTGTLAIFGLQANDAIGDMMTTPIKGTGAWQQVFVPLTVTQPNEQQIRVQVYETTASTNFDLDGAELINSGLTNASFAKQPEYCGPPPGWFLNANGGTENACAYNKPSGAQQGSTYLEFNANVAGASVGQNIGIAPQIGQSYTFSTWVKAPSGSTGTLAIFGLQANDAIGDMMTTPIKGTGAWQQVFVPLTVTQPNEQQIRVQVYETTASTNFDLDGAELINSGLTNASFAKQPEYCGPPPGWFLNANGGTENACAYNKPSGAQQGATYLEFNANVAGASVGQNIGIAPQIGQSYTFSTWVKAPSGSTGTLAIFGLQANDAIGDMMTTPIKGTGAWQQVFVPLTVTQPNEQQIRVQVYETTASTNFDLDGAEMH